MDTVLIVDDSSFIVEGLIAFLKKKYRTIAAYGGAECLEILKRETPSVIILDIMMEPMDGWETLTHIKENEKTRHIPVLMFSAKKISPEEAEEHRVSIDDFITKPVSPKKIIDAIEKVLTRRDTNRVVVERWQSAGISQKKIDDYLTLTTSLEVDLSLCQNMKIQYDLVHPADKNQEEFHAVIRAIEERILQERDLIEQLAREMNNTLVQGIDDGKSAGPGGQSITDEPANRHESADTRSDSLPLIFPEATLSEIPADGLAVIAVENLRDTDPDHMGSPATNHPPVFPANPEQDNLRTNRRPDLPDSEVPPEDFPISPAPAPTETPRPDVVDIETVLLVPVPGEPESVFPGRDAGQNDNVREIKPEPAPLSLIPPPVQDPTITGTRKVIPADLDRPPAGSRTSALTGAGTDIPMPWDNPRDRKASQDVSSGSEKKEIIKTGTPSLSPGIFARIISLLQSLFSKRN
jgi:CheY-like chemotaxis protein